ncbi:MAG TPA: TraB/GumN family protein [Burkholderiales bacterium]|nr:TraB/GumN family protein [Burkholderiales bacterium]
MRSSASWISRNHGSLSRRVLVAAAFAAALALGPAAARAAKHEFHAGLLWRISKPGVKDSFVFGTIHLPDPRVNAVPKPVDDALAESRTLAIELVPGAIADARVFDLELLEDGRTLESLIGREALIRVRERLVAQEIPEPVLARLKPWAVLVKLGPTSPRDGEQGLDQRLLAVARARRIQVAPLELPEEQIAAFDSVPMDSQVALLKHALDHRDALDAAVAPTIDAWLRGDLAGLARIGDRMGERFPGMGSHYRELTKHIVHNRTILMHHRLALPLRGGRVFVAVGAMHLYGSKGLLALLQRDGYRVTRIA